MSSTTHAVQIPKHGDSSVLAYVPVPKPTPKPDQVLVKVAYAGVNFIDTYQRSGLYPQTLPFIVGREGSGEIVEVGPEVKGNFKVGDRVAFMGPGSYAEYDAVSTLSLAKLPDAISLEQVCLEALYNTRTIVMQGMSTGKKHNSKKIAPWELMLTFLFSPLNIFLIQRVLHFCFKD